LSAPLRISAAPGRPPLGAIFGAIGVLAGIAVAVLHLDRLPVVFCTFKALTGLPCPTCGSTRALGRLALFDVAGAFTMNPLATLVFGLVAVWAFVDLMLLPQRRALSLEVQPRLRWVLRTTALVLFLANWVYLLVASR
jgi:hypothetical protein